MPTAFVSLTPESRCPCLSGASYGECCLPFHDGSADAPTALQLMRSRFTAFVVGDTSYLRRTWHPSTRPTDLELDPATRWRGLEIIGSEHGGPFDTEGTVEFVARYRQDGEAGAQHEVSHFVREAGTWHYVS